MQFFIDRLSGFTVDSITIILVLAIFLVSRSKASLILFVSLIAVVVLAHTSLLLVNYSKAFNVDYHLMLFVITSASLAAITLKVNGYFLLKCAIGLNILLHAVMIAKEPMLQMYWIDKSQYNVIYSTYEEARILIVSLQIMGLINGDVRGGEFDDFNNRIRARVYRVLDHINLSTKILLRVKKQ